MSASILSMHGVPQRVFARSHATTATQAHGTPRQSGNHPLPRALQAAMHVVPGSIPVISCFPAKPHVLNCLGGASDPSLPRPPQHSLPRLHCCPGPFRRLHARATGLAPTCAASPLLSGLQPPAPLSFHLRTRPACLPPVSSAHPTPPQPADTARARARVPECHSWLAPASAREP